jgi:Asp-tRNA(Asn)/Glu-tRNA(Gln) amidotransferase A subunit family amidase
MAARPEITTHRNVNLRGRPVVQMVTPGMPAVSPEIRERIADAVQALTDVGMSRVDHRLRGSSFVVLLWLDWVLRAALDSYLDTVEDGAPSPREMPAAVWRTLWGNGPVSGPVMWAVAMAGVAGAATLPFHRALARMREAMLQDLCRVAANGVVVLPAFPAPVPRHNWTYLRFLQTAYFLLANALSAPALIIPAGVGRGGLPLAVQIIGPPGVDRVVLAAGRVVEEALGGWGGPVEPDCARGKR